jgi:hypothetical protein
MHRKGEGDGVGPGPGFGITVRYGLDVRPPIIQKRVASSEAVRRFLNDMEWNNVIRIEIEVHERDW